MSDVTIVHTPCCSKARESLALLDSRGIAPRLIVYPSEAPSSSEVGRNIDLLGA